MTTFSVRPKDITRSWYLLDASKAPLGRVASVAARLLLGKGKPNFSTHIDVGDFVVVINASKLVVTGDKTRAKTYYRHSGFPGGLRSRKLEEVLTIDPNRAVIHAVRGMLPDNKLRAGRLKRLKVYVDDQHRHSGQKPVAISVTKEK